LLQQKSKPQNNKNDEENKNKEAVNEGLNASLEGGIKFDRVVTRNLEGSFDDTIQGVEVL
jgi:hypothetical protein